MTIQIKGLGGAIVYLGIGFLVYMLIYAPDVFIWSDPWVYIISALWPFALAWEFFVIILWLILIAFAIGIVYIVYDYFRNVL